MKRLAGVFVCLSAAACGTVVEDDSTIGTTITSFKGAEISPRFAALTAANAPVLQIGFVRRGEGSSIRLERRDGDFEYWLSPDGAQIILQKGVLHGTRGLGEGLLAAELSEPIQHIKNLEPGFSDRFHTYLNGNDQAMTRTFRCNFEVGDAVDVEVVGGIVSTRQVLENCRSLDQEFDNIYWVDPSTREIVQSRQWAGPFTGAISTRIVK
ncbi:YjbF family lipoprotein [Tateyamaria sp.]|uniref:YjbF family lipoprotein n=1 Tax=Tateyamaria sp. TaxID=1929288 RepID=UPI00329AD806